MKKLTAALVVALGIWGSAWAQEKPKPANEPSVTLKEIDTNKDGKLTLAELQAAIEKLQQKKEAAEREKKDGEKREGGDKKRD